MGRSLNPSVQATSTRSLTFVDMLDLEAQEQKGARYASPQAYDMGLRRD